MLAFCSVRTPPFVKLQEKPVIVASGLPCIQPFLFETSRLGSAVVVTSVPPTKMTILKSPGVALALMIAARMEPGTPSSVVVTAKVFIFSAPAVIYFAPKNENRRDDGKNCDCILKIEWMPSVCLHRSHQLYHESLRTIIVLIHSMAWDMTWFPSHLSVCPNGSHLLYRCVCLWNRDGERVKIEHLAAFVGWWARMIAVPSRRKHTHSECGMLLHKLRMRGNTYKNV